MRTTTICSLVLSAVFVTLVAPACKSQATTICDVECDCEHCNNYEKDLKCDGRNAEADIADAYGCADKWETWATCFEEQGSCDESKASYSTVKMTPGSCTGTMTTAVMCPTGNADCATAGPMAFCDAGTCKIKTCLGMGNPCTTNAECGTAGQDR